MNRSTTTLVLCAAFSLGAAACEQKSGSASASSKPPPNAKFMEKEETPDGVAMSVFAEKNEAARKKLMDAWKDMWIPEPGWDGTVDQVNEDGDHMTVWISYPAHTLMGGSFKVGLDVPEFNDKVTPSRILTYTGRIDKITLSTVGGVADLKIIVRNARILTIDGK